MTEKRSCRRVRDQVAHLAFGAETRIEIERARISIMARSSQAPTTGRIQKRKTSPHCCIIFGLRRAAGPYRWAMCEC